jgi:hypothetical protein
MESQVLWGLSPAPGPEGAPVAAPMREGAKRSRATRSLSVAALMRQCAKRSRATRSLSVAALMRQCAKRSRARQQAGEGVRG